MHNSENTAPSTVKPRFATTWYKCDTNVWFIVPQLWHFWASASRISSPKKKKFAVHMWHFMQLLCIAVLMPEGASAKGSRCALIKYGKVFASRCVEVQICSFLSRRRALPFVRSRRGRFGSTHIKEPVSPMCWAANMLVLQQKKRPSRIFRSGLFRINFSSFGGIGRARQGAERPKSSYYS